jgi:hypothetical protein
MVALYKLVVKGPDPAPPDPATAAAGASEEGRRGRGDFEKIASLVKEALVSTTAATPIEICFQHEARVGQKGGHAYIWAPIGSQPPMVRDNPHDSVYIIGAICPARPVGAEMITPAANTEAMNLEVPANISLLSLPPYSQELNPTEKVWDYLLQNKLCSTVWGAYDDILEVCIIASNLLIDDPDRIRSNGSRDWVRVNA